MPGSVDAKDTVSLHWVYSSSHRLWEILEDAVRSRNRTRVVGALFVAADSSADPWRRRFSESCGLRQSPVELIPDSARLIVMTSTARAQTATVKRRQQNPERGCLAPFNPPDRRQETERAGESDYLGKSVMEVCVQLKICEGCGCLWYRAQTSGTVYCTRCKTELEKYPSPESRKRRGRPATETILEHLGRCRRSRRCGMSAALELPSSLGHRNHHSTLAYGS